ncbi:MAG: helix-turn-helix transcriptional regulator [Verrucomicrobia bacterium]|nr:helix-turn-helix transcriptional regulator [Verrucomicrobiota bacterium]
MQDNRALQDLCAHLIREPHRLVLAEWARPAYRIDTGLHAHPDLLQLDLMIGLKGAWGVPGGRMALEGVSGAVFYPGDQHGYAVEPCQPDAQYFSFKLRVARVWPAVQRRIFAGLTRALTGEEPLVKALRRVSRLHTVAAAQAPMLGVALCEVLCLWPRAARHAVLSPSEIVAAELDEQLESALTMIDARLASPPTLGEMARAAHLSPRQFTRRFRALCGATPHEYVTARRLVRARELLVQGHLNVTQVAEALGFPSIHVFSRWFRLRTGKTPSQFREHPPLL